MSLVRDSSVHLSLLKLRPNQMLPLHQWHYDSVQGIPLLHLKYSRVNKSHALASFIMLNLRRFAHVRSPLLNL